MDGRPKRIKKFALASVCVYNRLRVDGAKVRAARAARLFFLVQPIRSFFSGVVVAVASYWLKLPIRGVTLEIIVTNPFLALNWC